MIIRHLDFLGLIGEICQCPKTLVKKSLVAKRKLPLYLFFGFNFQRVIYSCGLWKIDIFFY